MAPGARNVTVRNMRPPRRDVKRVKKPRSRFHHGDLYEAAVTVASAELDAHGYAALTLATVAEQLGVTRPALYRHFADKRALLAEVAQRRFILFEARLTEAVLAHDDPIEALRDSGRAYIRFAFENPSWFQLQFFSPAEERPMPDLERTPARYYDRMLLLLSELLGDDEHTVHNAYLSFWGQMHGLSSLLVERVFGPDLSDETYLTFIDDALSAHLDGLAARALKRPGARKRRPKRPPAAR